MSIDPSPDESPLPPHIRRFAPWAWHLQTRLQLLAILTCLYAPFSWLLIERDWTWLRMWPILPGLLPGAWLFHPHDVPEFTTMGVVTLALIVGLTWLAKQGRWLMVLAVTLALLISGVTSRIAYSLYWF